MRIRQIVPKSGPAKYKKSINCSIPKAFSKRHTVKGERNEMLPDSVTKWITEFLDKPIEIPTIYLPCPFAKQALLTNKIKIQEIKPSPYKHERLLCC